MPLDAPICDEKYLRANKRTRNHVRYRILASDEDKSTKFTRAPASPPSVGDLEQPKARRNPHVCLRHASTPKCSKWFELPAEVRAHILEFVFAGTIVWFGRAAEEAEYKQQKQKHDVRMKEYHNRTQRQNQTTLNAFRYASGYSLPPVMDTPYDFTQVPDPQLAVELADLWSVRELIRPLLRETAPVPPPILNSTRHRCRAQRDVVSLLTVSKAFATPSEVTNTLLKAAYIKIGASVDVTRLADNLTTEQKHMKKTIQLEACYPKKNHACGLPTMLGMLGKFAVSIPSSTKVYISISQTSPIQGLLRVPPPSLTTGYQRLEPYMTTPVPAISLQAEYDCLNVSRIEAEIMILNACTYEHSSGCSLTGLGILLNAARKHSIALNTKLEVVFVERPTKRVLGIVAATFTTRDWYIRASINGQELVIPQMLSRDCFAGDIRDVKDLLGFKTPKRESVLIELVEDGNVVRRWCQWYRPQ